MKQEGAGWQFTATRPLPVKLPRDGFAVAEGAVVSKMDPDGWGYAVPTDAPMTLSNDALSSPASGFTISSPTFSRYAAV